MGKGWDEWSLRERGIEEGDALDDGEEGEGDVVRGEA